LGLRPRPRLACCNRMLVAGGPPIVKARQLDYDRFVARYGPRCRPLSIAACVAIGKTLLWTEGTLAVGH
jgi:hypothetical protein